jgi:DNA-binding transcriptional LysR family regulator
MLDLKDLDPSNLMALHALLEERQVTRAARRLGITQSSMSHRLGRLRRDLKDPLFVHTKAGLAPTPRAQAIQRPLRDALEALRAAVAPPALFDPRTSRWSLSLAMPDLLVPLVPGLLADLASQAPTVDVRVSSVMPGLVEALSTGKPALALAPTSFVDEGTMARPLGAIRFGVATRKGHPLHDGPLTAARWLSYPHVVVRIGNDQANVVEEALARRRLVRRVGVEVPSFLAGLLIVASSDLVMNTPIPIAHEVAARLGLVVCAAPIPIPKVPFALLWHPRFHAASPHRWARELVFGAVQHRLRNAPP